MKKSYNKILTGALVLGAISSPALAFAAETKSAQVGKGEAKKFCTNIDSTATKLSDMLAKQTDTFNKNRTERFGKLADKRKTHDEDISAKRLASDSKHDKRIDALTKKANTDAKKAAVTKFNSDIDAAVSKRQASVDAAVKTYRDGVDSVVNNKNNSTDTNLVELKKSVDLAVSTAKAACASGADPKVTRDAMQKSLKSAHEKYRASKTDTEVKAQLKTLVDARNAAIKAAQDQFKADTEKAKVDLKTAFSVK